MGNVAKGLRIRVNEDGQLFASISKSSGEFFLAPEVLFLLMLAASGQEVSARSLRATVSKTLEALPDESEIKTLSKDLASAGLLLDKEHARDLQSDGFGDPWVQWTMIADAARTLTYIEALREKITARSRVLDVGTGSGILAAAALHAGAAHVQAIEETQVGKHVKSLFSELKLPLQRLSFHLGNSEDVEIDPQTNLVVSELFGNDPFAEGVVPTLRSVAQRLQVKAQFIPRSFSCFVEVVDVEQSPIGHRVRAMQRPQLEVDDEFLNTFASVAKKRLGLRAVSFPFPLRKAQFLRASEPLKLGKVELSPPLQKLSFSGEKHISKYRNNGSLAALFWYRIDLDGKRSLSNHPLEKDFAEHWSPIVIPFQRAAEGDELVVRYALSAEEDFLNVQVKDKVGMLASRA